MNPLLKPLELSWRALNRLRRTLYRRGILRPKRLPRPVISVGNIAAGGTGKTPAVIALARHLEAAGFRVAVLSRGYGRAGGAPSGIVNDNDAVKWGDEPVVISHNISGSVIVGKKRYQLAKCYLKSNDCDVFILDDGFQHLQLHRDFDIVIDSPSAVLREGRQALRHAEAVVPRRLAITVPEALRSQTVFAFSGLADNRQFFESLRQAGLNLAGTRSFSDHHRYSPADLDAIRREAAGLPIVTTEKDAVKIGDPSIVALTAGFQMDPAVLTRAEEVASTRPPRRPKRRKGVLLERAEYAAYRAVTRAVGSMSEAAAWRWGGRLGAFAGRVLRRRDRIGLRNLELVFPERSHSERRAILDCSWRHFGREFLLYLRAQNLSRPELVERCPVFNFHLLEESIARGKGTILMTGHLGSWEMGGLVLMSRIRNVRAVARPLDNRLLERDLQQFREKTGAAVVDRRRAGRFLLRSLQENAVVVLLPDQAVQPQEGELVPFLGHPAWTTSAPAKLALRTGATIVFGFCIPDGLRHRLELVESIRIEQLSEEERDPVRLTARINEVIARRVRSRPDLYLWMHDRWKGTGEVVPDEV